MTDDKLKAADYYARHTPGNDEHKAFLAGADWAMEKMREKVSEENMVKVIEEWKIFWMNQKQNSQADYENYFSRAMGVDANMKYHLARLLYEALRKDG